jgi:hypothetical protein
VLYNKFIKKKRKRKIKSLFKQDIEPYKMEMDERLENWQYLLELMAIQDQDT